MKVVLAGDPEARREPWHMFLDPDDDYIVPAERLVVEYVNGIAGVSGVTIDV